MGVQTGSYRIMRQTSYAGAVLSYLAFPFMLDALWTLIPAVLVAAVAILRTGSEDRMLREELQSYQAYAERTRYRLLPETGCRNLFRLIAVTFAAASRLCNEWDKAVT